MKLLIPLLLITTVLLAGCDGPESWCKEPNRAVETKETRDTNVTEYSGNGEYTITIKQSKWDCKDEDGHVLYSTWIDLGKKEPSSNRATETPGLELVAIVAAIGAALVLFRSRS